MSDSHKQRWLCNECGAIVEDNKLLSAPHPFDIGDKVTGCPECLSVDSFVGCCDEPGCKKEGTCGFLAANGYRRTCYTHSDFAKIPK